MGQAHEIDKRIEDAFGAVLTHHLNMDRDGVTQELVMMHDMLALQTDLMVRAIRDASILQAAIALRRDHGHVEDRVREYVEHARQIGDAIGSDSAELARSADNISAVGDYALAPILNDIEACARAFDKIAKHGPSYAVRLRKLITDAVVDVDLGSGSQSCREAKP